MKNKGFTLIELLAVIVILAVIALIATPIILDVIEKAKKGSVESSTLGYVDAAEKRVTLVQVDTSAIKIKHPGTYKVSTLKALGVEVKGDEPKGTNINDAVDGVIKFKENGSVEKAWLEFDDYYVYYDGKTAVASKEAFNDKPTTGFCEISGRIVVCDGTSSKSYVYATKNNGTNGAITSKSQGSLTRPDAYHYFRYELTNDEIATGTIPEACLYNSTYGGELCLKYNNNDQSIADITSYFGWNASTNSSIYSGVTCETSSGGYVCSDANIAAAIDLTDNRIVVNTLKEDGTSLGRCIIEDAQQYYCAGVVIK